MPGNERRERISTAPTRLAGAGTGRSMLRHPHLVFFAPGEIRPPNFQPDGKFAARFGHEYLFVGMGNLDPRDDHDFFRNPLVDQDAIAFAHRGAVFALFPAHEQKLSKPNRTGKPNRIKILGAAQRRAQSPSIFLFRLACRRPAMISRLP
jgi:hypothetical protein